MSISRNQAIEAGANLMIGVADVVHALTDGSPAASAILGLTPAEFPALDSDPAAMAIVQDAARATRFAQLTGRFASFVSEGTWSESLGDANSAWSDFAVGIQLLEGKEGCCLLSYTGVCNVPAESSKTLLDLYAGVSGRLSMDSGQPLTVTTLSALAGIAEKTLRMAANPQTKDHLRTTKDGNRTVILAEDAFQWLSRRADFKPSRYMTSSTSRPTFSSLILLSGYLRNVRRERGESLSELSNALGWSSGVADALSSAEAGTASADLLALQPKHLVQWAEHYEVFEPVEFSRQVFPLIAAAYADALLEAQLS